MNANDEPATVEQLQRLAQIGLRIERQISRSVADQLLTINTPTPKQTQCLERFGIDTPLRRHEATRMIEQEVEHRRKLSPTPRQERFLRERGLWQPTFTRGEAYDLIAQIVKPDHSRR